MRGALHAVSTHGNTGFRGRAPRRWAPAKWTTRPAICSTGAVCCRLRVRVSAVHPRLVAAPWRSLATQPSRANGILWWPRCPAAAGVTAAASADTSSAAGHLCAGVARIFAARGHGGCGGYASMGFSSACGHKLAAAGHGSPTGGRATDRHGRRRQRSCGGGRCICTCCISACHRGCLGAHCLACGGAHSRLFISTRCSSHCHACCHPCSLRPRCTHGVLPQAWQEHAWLACGWVCATVAAAHGPTPGSVGQPEGVAAGAHGM
mmetsp:Transcript_6885/g.21498  ORF Transcript_6885/g.21498 Transcript_6885/m.21498 type:complete len:263 (-) Transcript_6885:239-1027(-)